jgi:hypothetical protein
MVDAPPIGKQNSGFYRLEMNRPELDVGCWMLDVGCGNVPFVPRMKA